jgi:hypothetical protein
MNDTSLHRARRRNRQSAWRIARTALCALLLVAAPLFAAEPASLKIVIFVATEADADSVIARITTALVNRPRVATVGPAKSAAAFPGLPWQVHLNAAFSADADRESVRTAARDFMETAVGSDRVLSGSYAVAHRCFGAASGNCERAIRIKP